MLVDCCMTGYCCGYRRDSHFGGVSYMPDEDVPDGIETHEKGSEHFIPVDDEDTCIYLVKLNNGFARCAVYEKRPRTCRLYNCLTEKKIRYVGAVVEDLKGRCD